MSVANKFVCYKKIGMTYQNTLTWVALILLTVTGFFLAGSAIPAKGMLIILLIISSIKFLGIGFQFIELKKAHNFWKVIFVGILLIFVLIMYAVYAATLN